MSQRGHQCSVEVCKVKKNGQNQLHCVPKQPTRLLAWEGALRQKLKPFMRVCSQHFQLEDYIPSRPGARRHLKKNAVPFIYCHSIKGITENHCESDETIREGALIELERIPDEWCVTTKQLEDLERDANKLLCIIDSSNAFAAELTSTACDMGGLAEGCLGPFTLFPDLQHQLFKILDRNYEGTCNSTIIYGELLREVLILAIEKLEHCSRTDAENYLQRTNKYYDVRDK